MGFLAVTPGPKALLESFSDFLLGGILAAFREGRDHREIK